MLKILKKILIAIFISIIIIVIYFFDVSDRDIIYSRHTPKEIFNEFYMHKTTEGVQNAFIKNFKNPKYNFPKEKVDKIKIYRNLPLISRFTSKTVSKKNKNKILNFFNNPDNFNWSETTWSLRKSKFIIRFFNIDNTEIGKLWVCLDECGMIESIPFTPNIKYGHLNENGEKKLNLILDEIYN